MRPRLYPSDTTDAEWLLLKPLLPVPACQTRTGRPEKHDRRDIVDAIRYLVDNGCKWRALPADFPPWQTTYCRRTPMTTEVGTDKRAEVGRRLKRGCLVIGGHPG